jgi:RimJ/RimL family protein N-acetyltransferase
LGADNLRAVFLSGARVYLRAYVEDDKNVAPAWADSPFPVSSLRGEKLLADWHKEFWPRARRYALCLTETDEVVGGVVVGIRHLVAEFKVATAHWRNDGDELRAAALELVVPWLSDEWSMVSVTAHIPADQPLTIAAAERLGMHLAVRLREFYVRPAGVRIDELNYQQLRSMEAIIDA